MNRYFRSIHDPRNVYSPIADDLVGFEKDTTRWTEVQVVPLDAIVIRRDELPEVDATRGARVNSVGIGWELDYLTADREEKARSYGLAYLALAEYLREHPPVDEKQVKALKDLRAEWYKRNDSSDLLEFLASRGVRVGDA